MCILWFHRKTTEEAVNLERDPSSASMASSGKCKNDFFFREIDL